MTLHRRQEIHAADEIGLIVQLGLFRRFANECFSGKMKDSIDRVIREDSFEILRIAYITFDSRGLLNKRSMPGGKIIEDDWLETGGLQSLYGMAPDVSGTTGYENHARPML
jgi:hypothetical protein